MKKKSDFPKKLTHIVRLELHSGDPHQGGLLILQGVRGHQVAPHPLPGILPGQPGEDVHQPEEKKRSPIIQTKIQIFV